MNFETVLICFQITVFIFHLIFLLFTTRCVDIFYTCHLQLFPFSIISSGDEHITSLCEFPVHKVSHRHNDPVRRTLCVSETCLLERDPNSYAVVTLHPLSDVFALVRNQDNPQMFSVEYVRGGNRSYTSSDR